VPSIIRVTSTKSEVNRLDRICGNGVKYISLSELFIISKYSKKEILSPDIVIRQPELGIKQLLEYWVNVDTKFRPPHIRNWCNTNQFGFTRGRYTYATLGLFTKGDLQNFPDVILKRNPGEFDDEDVETIGLPEFKRAGDYSMICYPRAIVTRLLPHFLIYGGLTQDKGPLSGLHIGARAEALLSLIS